MRGRVDVTAGNAKFHGYYVIHPESSANPPVLSAIANGKTTSSAFNINKSATAQRWLFLTADDMQAFESGAVNAVRSELAEVIAQIRKLAQTPHSETQEGVDLTLATELSAIEAQGKTTTVISELSALVDRARQASLTFLSSVSVTDLSKPFDLTYMIQNPDFNSDATTGWTFAQAPGYGGGGAEYYETTFNFYQTLANMPAGVYRLHALAFQRPGEIDAVYTKYVAGTSKVTTMLYAGSAQTTIKNICDDSQPSALFNDGGWGSDKKLGNGRYVPNCMDGTSRYFAKGLYDNSVAMENATAGASFKIGLRCTSAPSYYWTMFDHFRLYFFGQNDAVLGIEEIDGSSLTDHQPQLSDAVYDLSGRRTDNGSLKPGLYIVRGKKVVIR